MKYMRQSLMVTLLLLLLISVIHYELCWSTKRIAIRRACILIKWATHSRRERWREMEHENRFTLIICFSFDCALHEVWSGRRRCCWFLSSLFGRLVTFTAGIYSNLHCMHRMVIQFSFCFFFCKFLVILCVWVQMKMQIIWIYSRIIIWFEGLFNLVFVVVGAWVFSKLQFFIVVVVVTDYSNNKSLIITAIIS